ncbi:MAG: hypothetical protein AAFO89_04715 [Planctomycetota bacterium]
MACAVVFAVAAFGQTGRPLLDSDSASLWESIASEGVRIEAEQVSSDDGTVLRIEYAFDSGAGFGIVRRPFDEMLAENYRFSYRVRGTGAANDLEFKLLDASGDNVWWVNRRAFVPPREWDVHTNRRRHFEFAWGPSGGEPIERTSYIEFAIASHGGGSGEILIEELSYEPLPPETPYAGTPLVTDAFADGSSAIAIKVDGTVGLAPVVRNGRAELVCEFGSERTLTALEVQWDETEPAVGFSYDVYSLDGESSRLLGGVSRSTGGTDLAWLGEVDVSRLRIVIDTDEESIPELAAIQFVEPSEVGSQNDLLRRMARKEPRLAMPPVFHDVQTAWTASGAPGHAGEAIVSVNGRVEFDKSGISIEPFLVYDSADVVGWSEAIHRQELVDDFLPIPIVERDDGVTNLRITTLSIGDRDRSSCLVEYAITNTTAAQLEASLVLAARPWQVLPHWQWLNVAGGFSPLRSVSASPSSFIVNDHRPVFAVTEADGVVAWDIQDQPLPAMSADSFAESAQAVQRHGFAAAAWRYDLSLTPGETARVLIEAPYADSKGTFVTASSIEAGEFEKALEYQRGEWSRITNRLQMRLPAEAEHLEHSIRSTLAYLLVNRDGLVLQPGSRTYERSWIRDGAISSAALLAFGHDDVVRSYLDWYAGYSFENGKVPCVVDHRGPDPVDEHDSTGQLLFAMARYARTTGDHSLLRTHAGTIDAAVGYLEDLIAERSTAEFEGTAYFGLVPESISHEGYSAKPMHSYWDCFFVLQGLRDASWMAGAAGGDTDEQVRRRRLAERFASSLHNSIRMAAKEQGVEYIPGCVELGDFDPTSTAVALAPLTVADALPQDLLSNTLDLYTEFFESRRLGRREWFDYTPYELRVIGAMHVAGRHDEAHAMTDWFLTQQTPTGWNQWPEVVYADPKYPGFVGDIPHTWCAAGLVNSFVTGLLHSAEDDIIIGAGIPDSWYEDSAGFEISGLQTEFGALHVDASRREDRIAIAVALSGAQATTRDVLVAVPSDLATGRVTTVNGTDVEELRRVQRFGRNYVRVAVGVPED